MKKLIVVGICALFVACTNTSENTAETGTAADLKTTAENPAVTGVVTDTTNTPVTTDAIKTAAPVTTTVAAPAQPAPAKTAPAAQTANKPSAKKGEGLIANLDCLVCHKLDVKTIGPAFADIAKKYTPTDANVNDLAEKIIKGGSGVWGQIPMTPHPSIPLDDAKSLALYVLSIK